MVSDTGDYFIELFLVFLFLQKKKTNRPKAAIGDRGDPR